MGKAVQFYRNHLRKYVICLRRIEWIDTVALYLKTYLYEKARLCRGTITGVKEYCAGQHLFYQTIEESVDRTVFLAPCFEKRQKSTKVYKTPDIYLAQLSDVQVFGECSCVLAGNAALLDIMAYDKEERFDYCTPPVVKLKNRVATIKYLKREKKIENAVFLLGVAPFNYYHLTVEILSRLLMVDQEPAYRSWPVLVDDVVFQYPQFERLFQIVNQWKHPVIRIQRGEMAEVSKLLLPSMNSWFPVNLRPGLWNSPVDCCVAASGIYGIRNRVLQEINVEPGQRKIYLSRKNNEKNRLLNEEQVTCLFREFGFEIIYPELLSLDEQIRTFAESTVVAGATGAALTNILYCQKNTKIVCIIPEQFQFYLYATIAGILEEQFIFLDAELVQEGENPALGQFVLDLEYARRFLIKLQNGEEK